MPKRLGNVEATPYVELRTASPLQPPTLEDEPLQGSHLSIPTTTRSFLSSVAVPVAPFELQPAPSTLLHKFLIKTYPKTYSDPGLTLADYRQEVLCIDNHYWKREAGKSFIARNLKKGSLDFKAGSTNQQSNTQPLGSPALFTPKSKSFNGGKPNNSGEPPHSSNFSQSAGQCPTFNYLGANGKVFPSERERRMKNNLCLFCSAKGLELKGRAAEVEETPNTTPAVVEEELEN
ncbi:hypothetical protein EV359DRAFT_87546 [Lentinula novae-zelandiae]|nr:hypothetical protein EV359DRAFT_87546 [Lentinula novae-zelandiae]